jgi:hypothetical protein
MAIQIWDIMTIRIQLRVASGITKNFTTEEERERSEQKIAKDAKKKEKKRHYHGGSKTRRVGQD